MQFIWVRKALIGYLTLNEFYNQLSIHVEDDICTVHIAYWNMNTIYRFFLFTYLINNESCYYSFWKFNSEYFFANICIITEKCSKYIIYFCMNSDVFQSQLVWPSAMMLIVHTCIETLDCNLCFVNKYYTCFKYSLYIGYIDSVLESYI